MTSTFSTFEIGMFLRRFVSCSSVIEVGFPFKRMVTPFAPANVNPSLCSMTPGKCKIDSYALLIVLFFAIFAISYTKAPSCTLTCGSSPLTTTSFKENSRSCNAIIPAFAPENLFSNGLYSRCWKFKR